MDVPQYSLARTADEFPDRPAVVDADTGDTVTFAELEDRSDRIAGLLADLGLEKGDHVAVLMDNDARTFEIIWATQRSGLYITPINWHLKADEARYIVEDCDAKVIFANAATASLAETIPLGSVLAHRIAVGSAIPGYDDLDTLLAARTGEVGPYSDAEGMMMLYSSGTTGRPKGILRPLSGTRFGETPGQSAEMEREWQGEIRHLCTAPLYHALALSTSMFAHKMGGTVVSTRRFEPERALQIIERHRVTHAGMVPTMFVRLLKLPADVRRRYDVSSLQFVIHTGAPCPIPVKEQMIAWWGEVVWEIYAGSEGNGSCLVDAHTWLRHKGTVGQAHSGSVHIIDQDGEELAVGEVGIVAFSGLAPFQYYKDPAKTATTVMNAKGWSTIGDLGHVDQEGFLYLSDRRTDLIISGGVNIYPREVENVLTMHPKVLDVAVIGIPDPEMGHQVKAVVQLVDPADSGPATEAELIAYCRDRIAHFKCPRTVDFEAELPRLPSGKLLKRDIMERYRTADSASA
ncbi:acyl-CoA synthetase [Cryptosporangium sp. NPDC051539]|uniref:acyl-CoA synthetase n=1 Tax=Cryptosporangium sp. NPDC051539 TaxID=3363962 RepID=UPI00378C677C